MYIYKITREGADFDEYKGHVVVANTRSEAIEVAKSQPLRAYAEPKNVWESAKICCVGEYSGRRRKPFILLSHNVGA